MVRPGGQFQMATGGEGVAILRIVAAHEIIAVQIIRGGVGALAQLVGQRALIVGVVLRRIGIEGHGIDQLILFRGEPVATGIQVQIGGIVAACACELAEQVSAVAPSLSLAVIVVEVEELPIQIKGEIGLLRLVVATIDTELAVGDLSAPDIDRLR